MSRAEKKEKRKRRASLQIIVISIISFDFRISLHIFIMMESIQNEKKRKPSSPFYLRLGFIFIYANRLFFSESFFSIGVIMLQQFMAYCAIQTRVFSDHFTLSLQFVFFVFITIIIIFFIFHFFVRLTLCALKILYYRFGFVSKRSSSSSSSRLSTFSKQWRRQWQHKNQKLR